MAKYKCEVLCKKCRRGKSWISDRPTTAPRRMTYCPHCKNRTFTETVKEISNKMVDDEMRK